MTDPADLAQTVEYADRIHDDPYTRIAALHAQVDELVRRLDQAERDRVEPREGIVTVYDDQGRYLGCMGIEMWNDLLRLERELVAVREIRRRYALASSGETSSEREDG